VLLGYDAMSLTNWIPNLRGNVASSSGVGMFSFFFSTFQLLKSRTLTLHHFNPLNPELNPICHLLALLGVHHFLHISRIRVKSLTLRLLMSDIYIYIWSIYS